MTTAAALDDADPLRSFLERFAPAPRGLIYLDGNSLGRLPRDTPQRIADVIEHQWGERLIRSWDEGWMALPGTVGDRLGQHLLGAGPGQVLLADSTTVCFYKLAAAAVRLRPGRRQLITDRDNFPSDRYVLEGLAANLNLELVWADPHDPDGLASAITDQTALVTFSHVDYRSARIAEVRAITERAHDHGALVLWDLSHSAGALPVTLDEDGVDLAVGCTYKYLNGGPGAPAFLYVAARHQARLRQPIWGWLGRADPFAMASGYIPASGVTQMLSGTPPIIGLTAAAAGIELSIEAGIDRIRDKSTKLTAYTITLADELLGHRGVGIGSPRDPDRRGGHVALTHPRARQITQQLAERDVLVDFREPDVIRLGLSPLTTQFRDVHDAIARLSELLSPPSVHVTQEVGQ